MKTTLTDTPLADLKVINIEYPKDERGFFIESWNKRVFAEAGLDVDFVQEGHSGSAKNVLRGLHFQDMSAPQGKLVRCIIGKVFDVAVDLRSSSATFRKWFGIKLTAEDKNLIYIPAGFAHGFLVLSDYAEVLYKMTDYWNKEAEGGIIWNDPDIKIDWPTNSPILSVKDGELPTFSEYIKSPAFS